MIGPVEIELTALEKDGRLTPEDVVAAARNPKSALHPHFNWDNKEAAHFWRLEQARTLIRSVKINITIDERIVRSVAYVRDPETPANAQGYVRLASIKTGSEAARDAMLAELSRVSSALERARSISEILELRDEVESLLRSAVSLRERVVEKEAA